MTTPMAQVVGARARKLRLNAGVTLEEMAKAANSYGLPWTSGRVGDFEAGRVAASLPTLVAATAALSHVIGRTVSLAELFAGDGQVRVNDNLSLDTSALRAMLSGKRIKPDSAAKGASCSSSTGVSTVQQPVRDFLLLPPSPQELEQEVLRDLSESDVRMCKNLSVDRERGAAAMAELWGRTFTAERNHRAGPAANAQKRGQVSRQLKAELQGALQDGHR